MKNEINHNTFQCIMQWQNNVLQFEDGKMKWTEMNQLTKSRLGDIFLIFRSIQISARGRWRLKNVLLNQKNITIQITPKPIADLIWKYFVQNALNVSVYAMRHNYRFHIFLPMLPNSSNQNSINWKFEPQVLTVSIKDLIYSPVKLKYLHCKAVNITVYLKVFCLKVFVLKPFEFYALTCRANLM